MTRVALSPLRSLVFGAIASVALVVGCGGGPAKNAHANRPIDEGRAVRIIADTLKQEGFEAQAAKEIPIVGKTNITLDVTIAGRKFAIVYLTAADAKALDGHSLAKKQKVPGDPLVVEKGAGSASDTFFVVLYAEDYLYDDNEGTTHETTAISAENRLDRDVRDFLRHVKKENLP